MSAEQPKPGDVVRLKSGSPAMTIVDVDSEDDEMVKCKWFEGSKVHEEWFPLYALIKSEP